MKKTSSRRITIDTVIFLSTGLLMLGLGHYRTLIPREVVILNYSLASGEETGLTVDIQDQGLPKRLVQPGRISITSPAMPLDEKGAPHWVQVTTKGFENGKVNFSSRNPSFDNISGTFSSEFQPGESVNLTADLQFSHLTAWTKSSISEGAIVFTDYRTGEALGEVSVRIINTGRSASSHTADGYAASNAESAQSHNGH
jgi:hypothetical protein